jgi:hypothetical protein
MTDDDSLRITAVLALDAVVRGRDETALMHLRGLGTTQLGTVRGAVEDLRALLVEVLAERQVGEEP